MNIHFHYKINVHVALHHLQNNDAMLHEIFRLLHEGRRRDLCLAVQSATWIIDSHEAEPGAEFTAAEGNGPLALPHNSRGTKIKQ